MDSVTTGTAKRHALTLPGFITAAFLGQRGLIEKYKPQRPSRAMTSETRRFQNRWTSSILLGLLSWRETEPLEEGQTAPLVSATHRDFLVNVQPGKSLLLVLLLISACLTRSIGSCPLQAAAPGTNEDETTVSRLVAVPRTCPGCALGWLVVSTPAVHFYPQTSPCSVAPSSLAKPQQYRMLSQ